MDDLLKRLIQFRDQRDWKQFHTPENLAKSISIEAAELLECFQWNTDYDIQDVKSEIADVFIYLLFLSEELKIDINEVVLDKLKLCEKKYPVSRSKGNATKYTKFEN